MARKNKHSYVFRCREEARRDGNIRVPSVCSDRAKFIVHSSEQVEHKINLLCDVHHVTLMMIIKTTQVTTSSAYNIQILIFFFNEIVTFNELRKVNYMITEMIHIHGIF